MNIILNGYNGQMGQVLINLIRSSTDTDLQVVAGIDPNCTKEHFPTFATAEECHTPADVIIDFSHHLAVSSILEMARKRNLPLVIATTGISEEVKAQMINTAQNIPVFHSANMSFGINLMRRQLRMLVPALEDTFNIEIVEAHHNKKKDSPSGTALLLADTISGISKVERTYVFGRHGKQDECTLSDIGIHAIRGGTIPGEHVVIFAGPDEVIEIKHSALSKNIFARGAIAAAKYLVTKTPGFYIMDDMLGEMEND